MIKVLGVGNLLLRDEGFGVHFVKKYKEEIEDIFKNRVEVIDGGTQTIPLLGFIENAPYLFIIDAVKKFKNDHKPGDVIFYTKEDIMAPIQNRIVITSHSGGIHELLATSELESSLPENIMLIGIIPADISQGLELSETMEKKMPEIKDILLQKIEEALSG